MPKRTTPKIINTMAENLLSVNFSFRRNSDKSVTRIYNKGSNAIVAFRSSLLKEKKENAVDTSKKR
jgi:hypothetical protein